MWTSGKVPYSIGSKGKIQGGLNQLPRNVVVGHLIRITPQFLVGDNETFRSYGPLEFIGIIQSRKQHLHRNRARVLPGIRSIKHSIRGFEFPQVSASPSVITVVEPFRGPEQLAKHAFVPSVHVAERIGLQLFAGKRVAQAGASILKQGQQQAWVQGVVSRNNFNHFPCRPIDSVRVIGGVRNEARVSQQR